MTDLKTLYSECLEKIINELHLNTEIDDQKKNSLLSNIRDYREDIIPLGDIIQIEDSYSNLIKNIYEIAKHLYQLVVDDIIDIYDVVSYDIYGLRCQPISNIDCKSYYYNRTDVLDKNWILIDFNESDLFNEILSEVRDFKFLISLLLCYNEQQFNVVNKYFVYHDTDTQFSTGIDLVNVLKYLIKLDSTLNNKNIFKHRTKNSYSNINHIRTLVFGKDLYVQFCEQIEVMNEYIHSNLFTDKYLKLYHIIEHFSIKKHVCEHVNSNNGISFRTLTSLVHNTSDGELNHIKKLFGLIANEFIPNDFCEVGFVKCKILDYVYNKIYDYYGNLSVDNKSKIDIFFGNLGISASQISGTKPDESVKIAVISKLIYYTRNSIVHNKESEYHLLEESIGNSVPVCLFEKLIFPTLETLVFFIIFGQISKLIYQNNSFPLY